MWTLFFKQIKTERAPHHLVRRYILLWPGPPARAPECLLGSVRSVEMHDDGEELTTSSKLEKKTPWRRRPVARYTSTTMDGVSNIYIYPIIW